MVKLENSLINAYSKPVERRLGALKKHIEQAGIYFKHKGKKPLTEAGQILLTAAKDYLKGVMNDKTTIPTKAWKIEYAMLTAERKTLHQRYLALKEEVKEAEKTRKAFTVSYGRNSGNYNRTRRRIWRDNRQVGRIVNTCHRRPIGDFHLPAFLKTLFTAESAIRADSLHFKKYTIPWNNQSVFVLYIKSITNAACIFYSHYLNRIFENSQRFQTNALIDG